MVWHIFKKDWKLMWRSGASVVALQLAYAFIQLKGEFGRGNPVLDEFHTMLLYLWLIAGAIWVVMLVHQDVLPGTRQDWLTRPIRRADVLLAKVLFAALVVQGSTISGDLLQGLGSGFPLGQSLRAAMVRAAVGFIAITVPALVIGALTESIAGAMILAAVFGVGVFVCTLMAIALGGGYEHQFNPTNASGVEWIPNLLRFMMALTGSAIVMLAQYRTRKTFRGRRFAEDLLWRAYCCCCSARRPFRGSRYSRWRSSFPENLELRRRLHLHGNRIPCRREVRSAPIVLSVACGWETTIRTTRCG
ncbi:MAG TPA: hypothetical protein VHU44_19025 [Acidobacteriaceae bacterium]|jgi:hypothetical protein|nr:hypothetical protein [Acidobacteriaceae bacterium]